MNLLLDKSAGLPGHSPLQFDLSSQEPDLARANLHLSESDLSDQLSESDLSIEESASELSLQSRSVLATDVLWDEYALSLESDPSEPPSSDVLDSVDVLLGTVGM